MSINTLTPTKNKISLSSQLASFKHRRKLNLRWRDINEFHQINSNVYLSYFEESRLDYLEKACEMNWSDNSVMLSSVNIDVVQPLVYEDKAIICTRCIDLGNNCFNIEHMIIKENEDSEATLMAKGSTELKLYDVKSKETIDIPSELMQKIREFEGI